MNSMNRWIIVCTAAALGGTGASAIEPPRTSIPVLECKAETEPMDEDGDAADDSAIWVHPRDGSMSLIIGTNKKRGLKVYDLEGKLLQDLPDGRANNVDVIAGVRSNRGGSGGLDDLVIASNRSDDTVRVYRIDVDRRRLVPLTGSNFKPGLNEVYGICGYVHPMTGLAHVVVNAKLGTVKDFELSLRDGGVSHPLGDTSGEPVFTAKQTREFVVGSQIEGMVADVQHGWLYIGEERVGVWRYPLLAADEGKAAAAKEGEDPSARALLDVIASDFGGLGGHLSGDVEGVTIYRQADGGGYILVSCQAEDRFAAYDRRTGRYVGSFRLQLTRADGRIERVTHTDGIEATSQPLGRDYPQGAFVVQDDNAGKAQNFKIADWRAIASSLQAAWDDAANDKH